jgi:hypothetical protein
MVTDRNESGETVDVEEKSLAVEAERAGAERVDFDDYAEYEEGDSLVICDRENANAWVKSDVTAELEN